MDFHPEPLPRRWTRALALAVLLTGAAIRPGGNSEANASFALARSLAEYQRYELGELAGASSRTLLRDGRRYADQPPGLAFIAWPFLAALRWVTDDSELQAHALGVALGGLAIAFSSVVVARIAHARFKAPPRWALALGATHALGTIGLASTGQFAGEPLAGALVLGAFALALPAHPGPRALRSGRALVIGGLLGWGVLVEPLAMPAVLAVALVVAATTDGVFAWVPIALSFALPQVLASDYAQRCFGHPFALGARLAAGGATLPPEVALARLAVGSPWLLLLPLVAIDAAVLRVPRGRFSVAEGACWLVAVLGLASVAAGLDRRAPWGGGPPAVIPFAPYLVLLLHPLRGRWIVGALVLFAIALAVQLTSLATDPLLELPAAWSSLAQGKLATSCWAHDAAYPGEATVAWTLGDALRLGGAWALLPLVLVWLAALVPPFAPVVIEYCRGGRRRIGV